MYDVTEFGLVTLFMPGQSASHQQVCFAGHRYEGICERTFAVTVCVFTRKSGRCEYEDTPRDLCVLTVAEFFALQCWASDCEDIQTYAQSETEIVCVYASHHKFLVSLSPPIGSGVSVFANRAHSFGEDSRTMACCERANQTFW